MHLSNVKKIFDFLAIALGFHYLCFTKIGCTSAMSKKSSIFLPLRSVFTTLLLRSEDRMHLGNVKKIFDFLAIALGFHYLCPH